MVSIKNHCDGKPHIKTLPSFKASVLKIPAEVCQKEVDTSVLMDKFKRLKRKTNIAYFVDKNDISFKKFPNLVDPVTRKDLIFNKVIGPLYVNKDDCREFVSVYGEVNILNVVKVVSKSIFFSFLMDGSTSK